jgi:hypothetical protein
MYLKWLRFFNEINFRIRLCKVCLNRHSSTKPLIKQQKISTSIAECRFFLHLALSPD